MPERFEDALLGCAHGYSPPDVALMQLLVRAPSEEHAARALGTAIWDALECRDTPKAERLGAVQKLWDSARILVESAFR